MQPKYLLLSTLLFISLFSMAQNKREDSGYIIYTLAKDTTSIIHFRLTGDDFTTTFVDRAYLNVSHLNVTKLKGRFFPNGELQYMEGYKYQPVIGKDSLLLQTFKLYEKNNSTFTEEKSGDKITEDKYPGRVMVSFYPYIYLPVLLANYVPNNVGDSIVGNSFSNPPAKFVMKRISARKLTAYSRYMGLFTLYLNERGKVHSIDGIGSSYNVKGTVVPYLNLDSLIFRYIEREQKFGPVGSLNKIDSVKAVIGKSSIRVIYTRPSMRGRVIFGEVVPWNRHWRTGANEATKINVSHPLNFSGKILPAGEYSIFTMPSQTGWTMMFNKDANIWGTDYDPTRDVLHVPMKVEQLKEPVELMTIEVVPTAKGGAIHIIWETIKASAHFTTSY
jgi:hypothetical protein